MLRFHRLAVVVTCLVAAGVVGSGCASSKSTASIAKDNRGAKRGADVPDPAEGRIRSAEAWGEQWTLSLAPSNSLEHDTRFSWGTGPAATGTLVEDATSANDALRLKGALKTAEGDRPATVTFATERCIDDGENAHVYTVRIEVKGIDVEHGCGDIKQ